MSKRKLEDDEKESKELIRKKQHVEESLLHKLMFHSDINQILFRTLPDETLVLTICSDTATLNMVPGEIAELHISAKKLMSLLNCGCKFSKLRKLRILGDKIDESLVLFEQDFPVLRSVVFDRIDAHNFIITAPLEELIGSSQLKLNGQIYIPSTLKHLNIRVTPLQAQKLIDDLKNSSIESLKLYITPEKMNNDLHVVTVRDIYPTTMVFSGSSRVQIRIPSLESVQELTVHNVEAVVEKHCLSSPMRFLKLSTFESLYKIVGNTQFPSLHLFHHERPACTKHKDYSDTDALRIYTQCVANTSTEEYKMSEDNYYVSEFTKYFYCANISTINDLTIVTNSDDVFVKNLPNLKSFRTNDYATKWQIELKLQKLDRLILFLNSFNCQQESSLFSGQKIKNLTITCSVTTWNGLNCSMLRNVANVCFYLIDDPINNISPLTIHNLPNLTDLQIKSHIISNLEIRLTNLPSLKNAEVKLFGMNEKTSLSVKEQPISHVFSLKKEKTTA